MLALVGALWASVAIAQPPMPRRGPRPLDVASPIGYFIDEGRAVEGGQAGDRQLAEWALQAWRQAAGDRLTLQPAPRARARIQVVWAGPQDGQYGEMRGIDVDGAAGAVVFIRPDTSALGPDIDALARRDPLFRDTVVYLTCLHELGHAFGLEHTNRFEDIMYSFLYGGDIVEYFNRFRRQLKTRNDIARASGMSPGDAATIRRLYERAK